MFVPVKAKTVFRGTLHKKLIIASLLSAVLVCSLFICVIMNDSNGASLTDAVHVKNEDELKNAINNASKETTIALDKDITLTDTLTIPANKDITLTSNRLSGFYKLIGTADMSTITIETNGILKLDGAIITHKNGDEGRGIIIMENGQFNMYSGEISDNTANYLNYSGSGGGIYNYGNFSLFGGIISRNTATTRGTGGGVLNDGIFTMWDGKISGNTVTLSYNGGGVSNGRNCTFIMYGGEISHNTATAGGGVTNGGTFTMYGGKISNNINTQSYSTAISLGGGVHNNGDFTMSGGEIIHNSAAGSGGGVYHDSRYGGTFNWLNGVISDNTANKYKDVYPDGNSEGSSSDDETVNGHSNGFSLRDVIVICVCIVCVVGVVVTVLFFTSKKQLNPEKKKLDQ